MYNLGCNSKSLDDYRLERPTSWERCTWWVCLCKTRQESYFQSQWGYAAPSRCPLWPGAGRPALPSGTRSRSVPAAWGGSARLTPPPVHWPAPARPGIDGHSEVFKTDRLWASHVQRHQKFPCFFLTSHWWNMFHALSHHFSAFLRFTNLLPERLQLFFQGLELCGQLLDESVSEGIEKYVTTLRSAQATRQLVRKPWFGPRSEYFKRNNDPDCTYGGGFPRDRHNLALAQKRDSQTLNPRPHSNAKAKLLRHSYHF